MTDIQELEEQIEAAEPLANINLVLIVPKEHAKYLPKQILGPNNLYYEENMQLANKVLRTAKHEAATATSYQRKFRRFAARTPTSVTFAALLQKIMF